MDVQSDEDLMVWLTTNRNPYKDFILERLSDSSRIRKNPNIHETHHIINRFRRRDLVNVWWNKINLTYREHNQAHWLLYLCYGDPRDLAALVVRNDFKPPPGIDGDTLPRPHQLNFMTEEDELKLTKHYSRLGEKSGNIQKKDPTKVFFQAATYVARQTPLMNKFLEGGSVWLHIRTGTLVKLPRLYQRKDVRPVFVAYERNILETFDLSPELRAKIEQDHADLLNAKETRFGTNLANMIKEQHAIALGKIIKTAPPGKKKSEGRTQLFGFKLYKLNIGPL